MIPAFFAEEMSYQGNQLDLTRRSEPIVRAIRGRTVKAFAPEQLIAEFLKVAARKIRDGVDGSVATTQMEEFSRLFDRTIQVTPMYGLIIAAWDACLNFSIPAPDSWYVACALACNAELWISHRQKDGIVDNARECGCVVRVLTEDAF